MFNNEYYRISDVRSTEEELSVAALHSVVACVGGTLQQPTHKSDSWGVDVDCKFFGRFTDSEDEKLGKELRVQLKATRAPTEASNGDEKYWTISLDVVKLERYLQWDSLILVLFVVPPKEKQERWVEVDAESVVARRSLYWTFLRGYPLDKTKKTNTIRIPKRNLLTPDALIEIVAQETARKGRYDV